MLAQRYRTAALVDVISLLLGVLLFFAPWLFGFVSTLASENAWLSGALISLLATAAIIAFDAREQRLNLILGLWVTASPWLLGFHAERHIHFIVGLSLVALTLLELWLNEGTEDGETFADDDAPRPSVVRPRLVAPLEPERWESVAAKRAVIPASRPARSTSVAQRARQRSLAAAITGEPSSRPRRPARSAVRADRARAE